MKNIAAASRVKVSADGHGVVSHAGMAMVRELADCTGLSAQVTAALADTYRGPWMYALGEVFADLAAAVADGADCIDADGMRVTAFITDTEPALVPGQVAGLELRHRQHARIEDRIRELKATGLRNLPCHAFDANAAWLEIILTAADLVTWARLIGFTSHPGLARAETTTFRYRVLHVAARITRGARQLRLRIDATWLWASAIATAWQHLRTAFG
ncbi:transposase [Mycobacterium sp. MUNTM1]